MKNNEYVIDTRDEKRYNEKQEMTPRLAIYWHDFINLLPETVRSEAERKGFKFVRHESNEKEGRGYVTNLKFYIPGASENLKKVLKNFDEKNVFINLVMCMHDEI